MGIDSEFKTGMILVVKNLRRNFEMVWNKKMGFFYCEGI